MTPAPSRNHPEAVPLPHRIDPSNHRIRRAHSCRFPYGNLRGVPVGHAQRSAPILAQKV
jgi:hypothetical protein